MIGLHSLFSIFSAKRNFLVLLISLYLCCSGRFSATCLADYGETAIMKDFWGQRRDKRDIYFPEEVLSPGDPVPRIGVPLNYEAVVYAEGLSSPDGLAFSPDGLLYVAEESAGRVSRVYEDGTVETFASGISSPEGIAFDDSGNLYVVEDIESGRLLQFDPDGVMTVISQGRDAPEGVVFEGGTDVLITESNVQFTSNPFLFYTSVTRVSLGGSVSDVIGNNFLWSYSGITLDFTGLIYVCNEASGTGTQDSVFTVDPVDGARTLFCSGLTACEGLRFSPGGFFPLYVAEEDLGSGNGRVSKINDSGSASDFAVGFYNIEDVALDAEGWVYVSEDTSGMIILIRPVQFQTPTPTVSPTYTATIQPTSTPTWTPSASPTFSPTFTPSFTPTQVSHTPSPSSTPQPPPVPSAGHLGLLLTIGLFSLSLIVRRKN